MSTATRALALPRVPSWYGPAAVATAAFAGLGVVGRPAGLGLSLLLLALVAIGVAVRGASAFRHWWLLAAGLACMPTLRTAGWVVAPSVLGCLGLLVSAAARSLTWGRLFAAPGRWLVSLVPGPLVSLALAGRGTSSAVLRGLAGAALLIALFGSLLSAADAAFAGLTGDLAIDAAGARVALAVLVLAVAGALALLHALPEAVAGEPRPPVIGRTEAAIALGGLATLFALFVAVQAATLFGGDAFVRRTSDLTYAQYARSGFWLLLVVAGLTLAVIAAAAQWTAIDKRLLGVLCLLTLVILASAWHRLDLYTDAYGPTRAREFAAWSIAWLAGLFALVLARRAVPRAVVTWSAILGLAFGLSNPDARIAAGSRPSYRATLSDDARGCSDRGGGVLSLTLLPRC